MSKLFCEHHVPLFAMGPYNWIQGRTEGLLTLPLDEELARYQLMAYLQRVEHRYSERKLYPYLDDLQARREVVMGMRRQKEALRNAMAGDLIGWELRTGRPIRSAPEADWHVRTLEQVIDMALPRIDKALLRGSELRQEIMSHIHLEPVGLLPLRTSEGYLLLRQGKAARVYAFALGLYDGVDVSEASRNMRTVYVSDHTIGWTCSYEHVKADLVRHRSILPNPAMFAFNTELLLPPIETFLPLAKQLVYELVAGANP
jgi:hypothetical protein